MKTYNHLVDVTFEVITTHRDFEDIPNTEFIAALERRLATLKKETSTEAYGNCGDCQEQ